MYNLKYLTGAIKSMDKPTYAILIIVTVAVIAGAAAFSLQALTSTAPQRNATSTISEARTTTLAPTTTMFQVKAENYSNDNIIIPDGAMELPENTSIPSVLTSYLCPYRVLRLNDSIVSTYNFKLYNLSRNTDNIHIHNVTYTLPDYVIKPGKIGIINYTVHGVLEISGVKMPILELNNILLTNANPHTAVSSLASGGFRIYLSPPNESLYSNGTYKVEIIVNVSADAVQNTYRAVLLPSYCWGYSEIPFLITVGYVPYLGNFSNVIQ
jgi:hypothetical protein